MHNKVPTFIVVNKMKDSIARFWKYSLGTLQKKESIKSMFCNYGLHFTESNPQSGDSWLTPNILLWEKMATAKHICMKIEKKIKRIDCRRAHFRKVLDNFWMRKNKGNWCIYESFTLRRQTYPLHRSENLHEYSFNTEWPKSILTALPLV